MIATLKSTPASAPDTKAAEDKSACTFFSDLPEIDYNTELGQFIASILIPHYRPVVRISKMVGDTKFEYVPVKRVRGVGKKGKNKKKNAAKRKSKKAAKAGDVQMKDVV